MVVVAVLVHLPRPERRHAWITPSNMQNGQLRPAPHQIARGLSPLPFGFAQRTEYTTLCVLMTIWRNWFRVRLQVNSQFTRVVRYPRWDGRTDFYSNICTWACLSQNPKKYTLDSQITVIIGCPADSWAQAARRKSYARDRNRLTSASTSIGLI